MEDIEKAKDAVEKLYDFRDHYFEILGFESADQKIAQVEAKMKETLQLVESLSDKFTNKAEFLMIKGKTLNVTPTYSQEAEEALSKAVKLDPKLVGAWNHLGECYWKKGNVPAAKNCFVGALGHQKNKVSLRNLSMALRQEQATLGAQAVTDSVDKAKEAVQMDIKDGSSWLILGNAYLSLFFAGSQDPKVMKQCMSAYAQAEKDPVAKNSQDLHFNRAIAYRHQEEYQHCLEGFCQATVLDPSWPDPSIKEKSLLNYLCNVQELVKSKGKLKGKKLQTMLQNLKPSDLGPYSGGSFTGNGGKTVTLNKCMLSELKEGTNHEKVVLGKVVCTVMSDDPAPFTFCIADDEESCYAVNVYNMAVGEGPKIGDSVAIPEPSLSNISVDHKNVKIEIKSIRLISPMFLVVNSKKLGRDKQAPLVLAVNTVST